MWRTTRDTILAIITVAVCGAILAFGMGMTRPAIETNIETKTTGQPEDSQDADKLWDWLEWVEYDQWMPWPGQSGEFYEGTRPHGAQLKMYVNRPIAGNLKDPPPGSIIIKENYKPDKTLAAVTVMRKIEGYNPDHGDWWWVKYTPDGSVAKQDDMTLSGKVASCIDCHKTAQGGDYIFTNDTEDGRFSLNGKAQGGDESGETASKNGHESNSQTASGSLGTSSEPLVVGMSNSFNFQPAEVTITVGRTVRWENDSDIMHTVTADPDRAKKPDQHVELPEGAETFHSGELEPGDSYERTFTVPGKYTYFCVPHERMGMVGTLHVKGADASSAADSSSAGASEKTASSAGDGSVAQPEESDSLSSGTIMAPSTDRPAWMNWLGRFHPAMTDIPIGLLLAAAVAETSVMLGGPRWMSSAATYCVWFGAVGAVAAGLLGWFFAGFRISDPLWQLTTHRWLGTATTALALITLGLMVHARKSESQRAIGGYRFSLLLTAALVAVTGFFGGAMVYGLDHYAWPA